MNVYQVDPKVVNGDTEGILRSLLADEALEEIMYNGPGRSLMVVHRQKGACRVDVNFDENYASTFAHQIAEANGRHLNANTPLVDGVLADGSRVNLTCPPASRHGITFTIRKFLSRTLTTAHLINSGTITAEAAAFLWCAIEGMGVAPASTLVVGGTSTGKTTTLAALALHIPQTQRIVLIEDTPELRLSHANMVNMVSSNEASMERLLVNALRMRPDRIIVGEVRGPEALTLFGAMNTGHDGCLGTIHANSARESITRVTHAPMNVPLAQVTALQLIVVMDLIHTNGGSKRIVREITEIAGFGEGVARMNQLFVWNDKKKRLERSAVPSRLFTKIASRAGMKPKSLEAERARRQQRLVALAKSPPNALDFVTAIAS